jgi:hypothetical protein
MNIRELMNMIENETYSSFSELEEKLLNYINTRINSFERREQDRGNIRNVTSLSAIYRQKLFRLLNQTLEEKTSHRLIYCDYHDEVELQHVDEIYEVDGELICDTARCDAHFTCEGCENIFHNNERNSFSGREGYYCEGCHNDRETFCDECDTYYCEGDDCECENHGDLPDYDTTITLHHLGRESSIRFEGVEIELHTRDGYLRKDIVQKFEECFDGYALCKRDGSLDPRKGFEMITTNASFQYHKNHLWNEFFKLNPNQYVKAYHGYNCGIHVHCNRSAYTDNQLRRLNIFYNNPENRQLIIDIAGRQPNQYCRFVNDIDYHSPIQTSGGDYKYRVINFNNRNTFEVRIFRSNIKQISFFRYLEFVNTVNSWIIDTDHEYDALNPDYGTHHNNYFDWLLKNVNKDYSNLLIFLDDRNSFSHLEHIEEWKSIYTTFKTVVHDFRINNQELIRQESEE